MTVIPQEEERNWCSEHTLQSLQWITSGAVGLCPSIWGCEVGENRRFLAQWLVIENFILDESTLFLILMCVCYSQECAIFGHDCVPS